MPAQDSLEAVALVFPVEDSERELVRVEGSLEDIAGSHEGIAFQVFDDRRGISQALGGLGVVGKTVIYGRVIAEEEGEGVTIAPIVYERGGPRKDRTVYREGLQVHVPTEHVEMGRVLLAKGIDIKSLESGGGPETFPERTPRHPSQSETIGGTFRPK